LVYLRVRPQFENVAAGSDRVLGDLCGEPVRAGINPFKIAATLSAVARLASGNSDVLNDAIADSSTSRVNLEEKNGFSYG